VSANYNGVSIKLKAEDVYDKEEVVVVMEDVFKLLQSDENGLSPEEAQRRLELFGPNKLESEEQKPFLQVSRFLPHYLVISPWSDADARLCSS
jgi:H+-transporting ATPase